jgi:hypothetical protein
MRARELLRGLLEVHRNLGLRLFLHLQVWNVELSGPRALRFTTTPVQMPAHSERLRIRLRGYLCLLSQYEGLRVSTS